MPLKTATKRYKRDGTHA